jgi:AtzE family amidohydrolase
MILVDADALEIAAAVRRKRIRATEVAQLFLQHIRRHNSKFNCFTSITEDRAIADANAVDAAVAGNGILGPRCGVPYAVKNSFDVRGLSTLAGSRINADLPPASQDATSVERMRQAGGILLGTLNMEEYAYGFTSENAYYGAVRNPHDTRRIAGGSSGGSAAAVAAGLVPLALGSDTGGSIRLPAALCGVFGLKPTFGRLNRNGCFPLAASFDTVGPFARTVGDLAAAYQAMLDVNPHHRLVPPAIRLPMRSDRKEVHDLRIATAGEYFHEYADDDAREAVASVAEALGTSHCVIIPEAERARMAHVIITAIEGASVQLSNLRTRPLDFEPPSRDRLFAGAISPASWYLQAQRFRSWFCNEVVKLFENVDVILAPTSPRNATLIGEESMNLRGSDLNPRAYMGMLTQPISLAGLPVVTVPVLRKGKMPLGVQIIAPPFHEDICFRVAWALEHFGAVHTKIASSETIETRREGDRLSSATCVTISRRELLVTSRDSCETRP